MILEELENLEFTLREYALAAKSQVDKSDGTVAGAIANCSWEGYVKGINDAIELVVILHDEILDKRW